MGIDNGQWLMINGQKYMKYITFEQIPVWQDSHKLTIDVYKLTRTFPADEKYSLVSQLRRSVSSVSANIVEGFYRRTTKDLQGFLYNSRGSAGETCYHLLLARDLGYLEPEQYNRLYDNTDNIIRQLSAWIKTLNSQKEIRK